MGINMRLINDQSRTEILNTVTVYVNNNIIYIFYNASSKKCNVLCFLSPPIIISCIDHHNWFSFNFVMQYE
jgi:hypothetical protein